MNIHAVETMAQHGQGCFGLYWFAEDARARPGFVDVRAIVQANTEAWLNDLARSHGNISDAFLKNGPWWWMSALSRLDARPWGYEEALKPLFFARAVVAWCQEHPEEKELTLVGCPVDVLIYLKDFAPRLQVNALKGASVRVKDWVNAVKEIFLFFVRLKIQGLSLLVKWYQSMPQGGPADCLVLYERFSPSQSARETKDYFYNKLFESEGFKQSGTIVYGCIDQLSFKFKPSAAKSVPTISLQLRTPTMSQTHG